MSVLSLKLPLALHSAILAHARADYPHEVCGLIGGRGAGTDALVGEQLARVPNVAADPCVAFEMERQAMIAAIFNFERARLEVVGIYHSHPESAAQPSITDIRAAAWPDAVYVIVGFIATDKPDLRAWSIRNGIALPAWLDPAPA